jgi:hypothetical protein
MQTLAVHELRIEHTGGYLRVFFRRFAYNTLASVNSQTKDVLSHDPLKVRVAIPPASRIMDMHEFDGKEILLIQQVVTACPLNNGE